MQEQVVKHESDPNPTVTPSDPRKLIVPTVVVGIVLVMMGLGWMLLKIHLTRQTQSEVPIKGVIVTNRSGEVVEHDERAKKYVSFGQNVLYLLPYDETAEARHEMQRAERMTLRLTIGTVELAATNEGRMVGVLK